MKAINLLAQAYSSMHLQEDEISILMKIECESNVDHVREEEYDDLRSFIEYLQIDDFAFYDDFYLNYSIPHIGKEFDLLRFGDNRVINIELKSQKPEEGIFHQLKQNHMYLSFLEKDAYCFTYEVFNHQLYMYQNDALIKVEKDILIDLLKGQKNCYKDDLDLLFSPANYMISPFNDPVRFMNDQYFLNQEQYARKSEILYAFNLEPLQIILLNGSTGSGKTLLIYDLIKSLKKSCIYHIAPLNEGQEILKSKYRYCIVNEVSKIDYPAIDYLIVDEAQRILIDDLNSILENTQKYHVHVLFAYDPLQIFTKQEKQGTCLRIMEKKSTLTLNLRGKVRGSKEINYFIEKCFDLHTHVTYHYSHIHVYHLHQGQIDSFLNYLVHDHHYTYIDLMNVNQVIGKEFDQVAICIDSTFYYDDRGNLASNNTTYEHDSIGLLYEAMTRAKTKLTIAVVDNLELYKVLLHILDN